MDYSKYSKAELKERRSELKRQAEKQFNRFEKLSSEAILLSETNYGNQKI